jgi:hypothetical protein
MPDSAVKRDSDTHDIVQQRRRRADAASASDSTAADVETEKKLARAARSVQRLAQLSEAQRVGETLDLFAEDAERANQQALNTDIRQGTFEGFELPDVFLAAVQSRTTTSAAREAAAPRLANADTAQAQPVQASFHDALMQHDMPAAIDTPVTSDMSATSADEAAPRATASAASPAALAARLVANDRACVTPRRRHDEPAPELDRARARAFADTVDALHAVVVEQRASLAAHARRTRTLLTIIVCVSVLAVVTGIAQTTILMRMRHDSALQQDRTEQLMLNQQATLASLFDTDSNNVPIQPHARETHPHR